MDLRWLGMIAWHQYHGRGPGDFSIHYFRCAKHPDSPCPGMECIDGEGEWYPPMPWRLS